jgi:hypothetical protein
MIGLPLKTLQKRSITHFEKEWKNKRDNLCEKNYDIQKLQTIIFGDDGYSKKILVRNNFEFIDNDYEIAITFEDIKKGSLFEKPLRG